MKNIRYFAIALVVLMITAVPTFAQVTSVKVDVPFEFQVGNRILPAGQYALTQFAGSALILENTSGKGSAVAPTQATGGNANSQQPHLTFHRYGEKYFLTEAWLRYSDTGRRLPASPVEIESARAVVHTGTVIVAMK